MVHRLLKQSVMRERILFGILGAIGALVYWRLAVFAAPLEFSELLGAEWRGMAAFGIAGFYIGWLLALGASKIGHSRY